MLANGSSTPNEFQTGWRIILLALLGMTTCVTAAILYGFGVLVAPLQKAFGWTHGELQLAITFLFGSTVLAAQLVAWLNKRHGLRVVTATSLAALSLGYLGVLLIQESIWSLYLAFSLLPLAGLGTLQVTWTQVINLWFERNRGLALALTLSGTGLAAAIMPPLLSWAIANWGWQAAFMVLALPPLLLTLPLTLCWLDPAKAPMIKSAARKRHGGVRLEGLDFLAALRQYRFWICNIAFVLAVSGIIGMVTNIVPILQDKGFSAVQAGRIFSSFGISLIAGRVISGYLVDRIWAPAVAALCLMLPALGCLIFFFDQTSVSILVLATALVGFGTGAEYDLAAFMVARYFGLREYGRLFAITFGLTTAAAAFSPLLFGLLLHTPHSYSGLLLYCMACFLIGSVLILAMGKYPRLEAHDYSVDGAVAHIRSS